MINNIDKNLTGRHKKMIGICSENCQITNPEDVLDRINKNLMHKLDQETPIPTMSEKTNQSTTITPSLKIRDKNQWFLIADSN